LWLYYSGRIPEGDRIDVYTGSSDLDRSSFVTASLSGSGNYLSGNLYIPTESIGDTLHIVFSASATTTSAWKEGFFIYLTSSDSLEPNARTGSWNEYA